MIAEELMQHPSLRLVFLQACESGLHDPHQAVSGVAMQLAHKNIPVVVAMQYKVANWVAAEFARAFYEALAGRADVDAAVRAGRLRIGKNDSGPFRSRAFGLPVLYARRYEPLFAAELVRPPVVAPRVAPIVAAENALPPAGYDELPTSPAVCIWCQTTGDSKSFYCAHCGAALRCSNCQTPVTQRGNFCGSCGLPLVQPRQVGQDGSEKHAFANLP